MWILDSKQSVCPDVDSSPGLAFYSRNTREDILWINICLFILRRSERISFPNAHVHFREYKGAFDIVAYFRSPDEILSFFVFSSDERSAEEAKKWLLS